MTSNEAWLDKYMEPDEYPPFEGKVIQAVFATDARFQNGTQLLLIWTMELADGTTRDQYWGVGKTGSGWFSPDGGASVQNRDGKKFHASSAYMRGVIAKVAQWGLGDALDAAGGPFSAKSWIGTSWQVGSEKVEFGGEIGAKSVACLLEYKGGGFGDAPAQQSPANPADRFNAVLGSLTIEERSALETAAKEPGALSDWAIANLPARMSDPAFLQAVIDPEFKAALLAVI